jgi:hypothetical protein
LIFIFGILSIGIHGIRWLVKNDGALGFLLLYHFFVRLMLIVVRFLQLTTVFIPFILLLNIFVGELETESAGKALFIHIIC